MVKTKPPKILELNGFSTPSVDCTLGFRRPRYESVGPPPRESSSDYDPNLIENEGWTPNYLDTQLHFNLRKLRKLRRARGRVYNQSALNFHLGAMESVKNMNSPSFRGEDSQKRLVKSNGPSHRTSMTTIRSSGCFKPELSWRAARTKVLTDAEQSSIAAISNAYQSVDLGPDDEQQKSGVSFLPAINSCMPAIIDHSYNNPHSESHINLQPRDVFLN